MHGLSKPARSEVDVWGLRMPIFCDAEQLPNAFFVVELALNGTTFVLCRPQPFFNGLPCLWTDFTVAGGF